MAKKLSKEEFEELQRRGLRMTSHGGKVVYVLEGQSILDNYFQGKELEKYLNRHRPIGS